MEISLDVQTINLIAGTFIPILVAMVAKKVASPQLKSMLNAALSALAGGCAILLAQNGHMGLQPLIVSVLTTFVTSAALYYGAWKPTGVAAKVQNKTANFGLGKESEVPVEPAKAPRKRAAAKPKT